MNRRSSISAFRPGISVLAASMLALVCMGCGDKQDYSDPADAAKASAPPKPTASGAVPSAHPPVKNPVQQRPDGM